MSLPATATVCISTVTSVRDNLPRTDCPAWGWLVKALTTHTEQDEKGGPLWSPALYPACTRRAAANVHELSLLVFDVDHDCDLPDLRRRLDGLEYVLHSSHSHTPEHPKVRVVIRLTRPVPGAEWRAFFDAAHDRLLGGIADRHCSDPSRIFFWPTCPPGAERLAEHHLGEALDPDEFRPEEPLPQTLHGPVQTPERGVSHARLQSRQDEVRERALAKALLDAPAGRNAACLQLACQLRDNGFSEGEALSVAEEFAALSPQPSDRDPFDATEARRCVQNAFRRPPREPWDAPQVMTLAERKREVVSRHLPVVRDALVRLKAGENAISEPEVLESLAEVRRTDPVEWMQTKAALRKLGISVRDLDRVLDTLEADTKPESAGDAAAGRRVADMLAESPAPDLIIPKPWELTASGVIRHSTSDRGRQAEQCSFGPVLITGKADGAEQKMLVVAWRHPGEPWASRLVPRATVLQARKLGDLAQYDFPYMDSRSSQLVEYLGAVEAANSRLFPRARIAGHMGWQGEADADTPFLVGRAVVSGGVIRSAEDCDPHDPLTWGDAAVLADMSDPGVNQIYSAYHARGTLAEWLEIVRRLRDYPRMTLCLLASLCTPLLEILRVHNFGLDLSSATGGGKTTAAMLAASVWGCPDQKSEGNLLGSWETTLVGAERRAGLQSHLPLILDDSAQARRTPTLISSVIYLISAGQGRTRGTITGIAAASTWRGVLITNGEQPLTSFTQDGGTRTRVLSVLGKPLGDDIAVGRRIAEDLHGDLCEHYGHAGVEFVRFLQANREHWESWRGTHRRLTDHFAAQAGTGEGGRLGAHAAVLSIAADLFEELWGFDLGDPLSALWDGIAAEAQDAAGEERALEEVLSWSRGHRGEFYSASDGFGRDIPDAAGLWDTSPDYKQICYYPHRLRQVLTEAGYSHVAILSAWRSRGWLKGKGRNLTHSVRVRGETTPMYVLTREAVDLMTPPEEEE